MNNIQEIIQATIGSALDNLGNSYQIFLSSASKKEKIQALWQIRLSAIDVHKISQKILENLTGKLIGPDPKINIGLSKAIQNVTRGNIHMQILNLDHLIKKFVMEAPNDERPEEEKKQEKIQYLYEIYNLSAEIADTALVTTTEPDKNTERA